MIQLFSWTTEAFQHCFVIGKQSIRYSCELKWKITLIWFFFRSPVENKHWKSVWTMLIFDSPERKKRLTWNADIHVQLFSCGLEFFLLFAQFCKYLTDGFRFTSSFAQNKIWFSSWFTSNFPIFVPQNMPLSRRANLEFMIFTFDCHVIRYSPPKTFFFYFQWIIYKLCIHLTTL